MKRLFISLIILQFALPISAGLHKNKTVVSGRKTVLSLDAAQTSIEKLKARITKGYNQPDFVSDLIAARVDSIIAASNSDSSLFRFTYNNAGSVTGYYQYRKWGKEWLNYLKYTYTYIGDNKKSCISSEIWGGSRWYKKERYTYTYSSSGFPASLLYETGDSLNWNNTQLITFQFNSKGEQTLAIYQDWDGAQWVNMMRIQDDYTPSGLIGVEWADSWKNGGWSPEAKLTYTYTDWGDILVLLNENFGEGSSTYRYTMTYNKDRLRTMTLTEEKKGDTWTPGSRTNITYNANATVQTAVTELYENGKFGNFALDIDTLTASRLILSHYYSYWEDSSWNLNDRAMFTYNSIGNILTEYEESFVANNVAGMTDLNEYVYDAAGKLLKEFHYSAWDHGVKLDLSSSLYVNIDSASLTSLSVAGKDVYFWYKQVSIPVELTSFCVNNENGQARLEWKTATETNNRGFEIERKTEGGEWNKIGYVAGNGTSAEAHNYVFEDKNLTAGTQRYRLKQIDMNGTFTYSKEIEAGGVVKEYSLAQNYPNPFNPETSISFALANDSNVKLSVYDITGRKVKELLNGKKSKGAYTVNFNASGIASGVYFYRMEAKELNGNAVFGSSKKMILIR
jgi:hypothetical protein